MSNVTTKKRTGLIAALMACLLVVGIMGTVAFMTSTSSIKNTFTKGDITVPTDQPGDPVGKDPIDGDTDKPIVEDPTDNPDTKVEGNIFEDFKENSKIGFNSTVKKVAYIGLGKNSENAYVFAKVDNNVMESGSDAYFVLGEGWAPVAGKVVASDKAANAYVSGTFMYVGSETGTPKLVTAKEDKDVYTTPVIKEVVVADKTAGSEIAATPTVDVSCFIYAPTGGEESADAVAAAKAWAE